MPLSYSDGTVSEHMACRSSAVVFDVSHLGTLQLQGEEVFSLLQEQLSNDLNKISLGRTQYTHLLDDEDASVLDDIIVWWVDEDSFYVIPNASNTELVQQAIGGTDTTLDRALIAVQGPRAREIVATVSPEAAAVAKFHVVPFTFHGEPCFSAGTGYTGEDGVECHVPASVANRFFSEVMAAGAVPAGLGARDTLRLEAGLPLHGHELKRGVTPPEANLDWVVGYKKSHFRGREAVESRKARGLRYRLFGIRALGRQPLRDGSAVFLAGRSVGNLTSGNYSPVLQTGIGLALLEPALTDGLEVEVEIRGRRVPALICKYPFIP